MVQHGKERNYVEEMDVCINRSMRPHCPAESSLQKKKRRLVSWVNNPELADKEVQAWKDSVQKAQANFTQFEVERDAWLDGFQDARRLLSGSLKMSVDHNKRLKSDGALLLQLIEQECGYSLRKKRNFHTKDIVDELLERQGAYECAVQEYLTVSQELHAAGVLHGKCTMPTTSLSLEEIHYPGDDFYIAHKRRNMQDAPTSAELEAPAVDASVDSAAMDTEVEVKSEPIVKADEAENPRFSECISDIPLPYFDSETKQVIPLQDAVVEPPTAVVAEKKLGGRTRAGSLSLIKVEPSRGTMDVEPANSSDEAAGDSDLAETTNPSSATSTGHGNWSPSVETPGAPTSKALTDQDLLGLFTSLQESVRMNELLVTDVEFAFQDRTTCADDVSIINAILRSGDGAAKSHPSKTAATGTPSKSGRNISGVTDEEQKAPAAPYLSLSRHHEEEWSQFVDKLFDGLNSQGIITRKGKKRGPDYVPVTVDLRLRTHRGVNLLLSPLSQYEDRMLGVSAKDTIYQARKDGRSGEVSYTSITQLPYYLRVAEEEALERCNLQSRAAIADLQIRKLRSNLRDIAKFTNEAQAALRRSESIHEMATMEESLELRKMYKELIHYGVVPANASDPPLSPITSYAAAAVANALYNSVFAANGANNRPAAKNSRAPARVYARPPVPTSTVAVDGTVAVGVKSQDAGSDGGTTTECLTKSSSVSSELRGGAEECSAAADAGEVGAESLKRKANGAPVPATSAPKRRR